VRNYFIGVSIILGLVLLFFLIWFGFAALFMSLGAPVDASVILGMFSAFSCIPLVVFRKSIAEFGASFVKVKK
jgi:membrane protein implicated in regulation of membrane protease activity